jgi:cytochrome c oxidase cbb3-type subunit 3
MRIYTNLLAVVLVAQFLMGFGCERHDPRPDWKNFDQERSNAQDEKKNPKLTAKGTLPKGYESLNPNAVVAEEDSGVSIDEIKGKYATLCASCHGAAGKGDGMASNPKPRNFTDKSWQSKTDDAKIAKVIKEGGMAAGLSALMPPWGAVLSDEEVDAMVKLVRSFGK